MQRLYSTFPDALPGFGLLVLRLSLAIGALKLGFTGASPAAYAAMSLVTVIAAVMAIAVALGIGTPIAASVLSLTIGYEALIGEQVSLSWALVGVGVSLVLIGPGAWSIDALIFGRRKISIQRRPPQE